MARLPCARVSLLSSARTPWQSSLLTTSALGRGFTTARPSLPKGLSLQDIEMDVSAIDLAKAKKIYDEYGCLVVRGLNRAHVESIRTHAEDIFQQAIKLLESGQFTEQVSEESGKFLGWVTPDQTLWIPAPGGHVRDKQVMVLGLDYLTSSAMFHAATSAATLDLVSAFLDSDNIEVPAA